MSEELKAEETKMSEELKAEKTEKEIEKEEKFLDSFIGLALMSIGLWH